MPPFFHGDAPARTRKPAVRVGRARYPRALRWAFAMQYPIWLLGVVQVLRYRRRARAALAERDPATYAGLRRGIVLVPAG